MSEPDVLFVNPGGQDELFQCLAGNLTAVEPPLWCRLLAGYCRDEGWRVAILDAEAERLDAKATAARVAESGAGLICFVVYGHQPSASTQKMAPTLAAIREIRKYDMATLIMLVGGHVAALPERTLAEDTAQHIDLVCASEGPVTIDRLLRVLRSGRFDDVPGLVWREKGEIKRNLLPPLVENLDRLDGDVWGHLPLDAYRSHNWQAWVEPGSRSPYASIHTSLGCPYRCSFCCINAPFHTNRYRMRDPADVVDEITTLYKVLGIRTLKITDEMFVLNERHYRAICEQLAATGFAGDLNIWAYARVDTIREGHLSLLRRAGIRWLALGIESGSAHVRDGAEKSFDDDDIAYAVEQIQEHGINVVGNFIFGLPDDDLASMRRTLKLATRLNCEYANFYVAMAYPGSRLFLTADPADLPKSWSGYSQHARNTKPLPTAALTSQDIVRFRDDAFRTYFRSARYRDMIEARFGARANAEIDTMLSYNLEREALA